ncbi:MAG: hypothetical protein K0S05_98 [Agromyces sp.]|nr:hypothetical protein [Agromyces sp.]
MTTRSRTPRVFLGTQEISGYYGGLEAGLTAIGVEARLVTTHPHPFGYTQARRNPRPAAWASRAVLLHRRSSGLVRLLAAAAYVAASALLLLWSLPRFDVFVFGWGISILPGNIDIPVLRLFRKRVISVLGHGSEARPPYMSTPPGDLPLSPAELRALRDATASTAGKVRRLERWSTRTVGLTTTAQFFRRPFVDFYRLGLPTRARARPATPEPLVEGELVVVHVPSNPAVKGTAFIRSCMEQIMAADPRVRYVEVSNRPHAEVIEALASATLVVDQLWSDIPMAVVGTEAASLGTATVISGYAWPEWRARWSSDDLPPTVLSTPDTLQSDIERALAEPESIREVGAAASTYVATRWNPETVARNYLRLMENDVPRDWVVDPRGCRYGWGVGVSRDRVESMVTALVDAYGVGSLHWPAAAEVYDLAGVSAHFPPRR